MSELTIIIDFNRVIVSVCVLLNPASCVESDGVEAAAAVRLEGGVGVAAVLARGVTTAGEPGPRSIRLSSTEASFNTCTSSSHTQSLTMHYTIHVHIRRNQADQNRSADVHLINFVAATGEKSG